MEMNLGLAIKRLRNQKGITQETLAEYIGVSYQAVSKWECNTTLPDIALLPKLAVFFGVRIDDLFSVNTDDELERIDYMLDHENLTDENIAYAKRILKAILLNVPNNTDALIRYAGIYLAKNNRDSLEAGKLLEHAMKLSPMNTEIYTLYRQARGCEAVVYYSGCEWFIRTCEPLAKNIRKMSNCMKYLYKH